jgi:hypothetical protein
MNPTIEIKQGINCHYIETRGVNVDDVPVGRYRLLDEAKTEELYKIIGTWTTPVDNAVPVRILNNWIIAAGLGKDEPE